MNDYAKTIYGFELKVPTQRGLKRYINLDNAASTPPFIEVVKKVEEAAAWYASVHRGTGFKSKRTTEQYELARQEIGNFVKLAWEEDVVIFTKNTTESINKVSHYLPYLPGDLIAYTGLEHHSNELPWSKYSTISIGLTGPELDLNQVEWVLKKHKGHIKLLAVSGASNVTGCMTPVHTLAELAHASGALILVDAAQLVPHRPLLLYPPNDPRHLDLVAFSGHKLYAPFGSGVLIGPRWLFSKNPPSQVGGGTVKGIGPAGIIWTVPPDVEEAGSPNVLGAIAMAEGCKKLKELGWEQLITHEQKLLDYTLTKLQALPGIKIYNNQLSNRVGVISFNIQGLHHQEVAEFLANAGGIGVRNGCFCARRYVQYLLNLYSRELLTGQSLSNPGMVRVSFGCYNQLYEVDCLINYLEELIKKATRQR